MKRKLLFFSSLAAIAISLTIYLQSCKQEPLATDSNNQNDSLFVELSNAVIVATNINKSSVVLKTVDKSTLKNAKYVGKRKIKNYMPIMDKEGKNSYFYVVNYEGGGYSVISANKRTMPILGYSDNGYFNKDSVPGGLIHWFEAAASYIRILKDKNVKQTASEAYQWSTLSCNDPVPVYLSPLKSAEVNQFPAPPSGGGGDYPTDVVYTYGPLISTTWGQGCGYNSECPASTRFEYCYRDVTGCVATCTAQVMYYWKYPSSYNWNSMALNYGTSETARLMKDIGAAVGMTWGATESGASSSNIGGSLVGVFG